MQEKTGLAILISDKIEIRMRNNIRENSIMKNGSIHEEDIMILQCIVYTNNTRQKLIKLKGEID